MAKLLVSAMTGPIEIDREAERRHSRRWCEHFRVNAEREARMPFDEALRLERRLLRLLPSLQDFQLGESSEGKHGLARATAYGQRVGDPEYAEAIRLFFAEENGHAGLLARYLATQGVGTRSRSWTDFAFRRVRRLMGLELLLHVLLTAELIGEVYYRAIRRATPCPALRGVCTHLLRDEAMHVRFHVERFALIRRHQSGAGHWAARVGWRILFAGTCAAVTIKHGRAMRLGGVGLVEFWRDAWKGWRRAVKRIAIEANTHHGLHG